MNQNESLALLTTEQVNPNTRNIDRLGTLEMVQMLNEGDKGVALAVEKALPAVARAVDCIASALQNGGRLVYIGAGTSGRLGILDASEVKPTFGVPEGVVIGLIAGGEYAIRNPVEGAEDDPAAGRTDLEAICFAEKDVLVGIAASGRTPYVIGAMQYARGLGAAVISLACVSGADMSGYADIAIEAVTGPESVSGSTRMKAGTAQKMVLNMLSTGAMIKQGKVYKNLMVDLVTSNRKLAARALRLTREATGASEEAARQALDAADGSVKLAAMMLKTGLEASAARRALDEAGGHLRSALLAQGIGEEIE